MSFTNTDIISIYNSRKTILEILNESHLENNPLENINNYENFNVNEVEAMAKNNQLDMLFTRDPKSPVSHNIYVKYLLHKTSNRAPAIDNLVEELYEIEGVLSKEDTLMIIINDEPNDSLITKLCHVYDSRGIFIVVHNIKRLQRNILKHSLVPRHTVVYDKILKEGEIMSDLEKLKQQYNLKSLNQLPEISRFDPVALLIQLRPGQVCMIERDSVTSVDSVYYRVCV
jgi:DNA-directed RNA polymerase subunit H (RpoH/RPB5)